MLANRYLVGEGDFSLCNVTEAPEQSVRAINNDFLIPSSLLATLYSSAVRCCTNLITDL